MKTTIIIIGLLLASSAYSEGRRVRVFTPQRAAENTATFSWFTPRDADVERYQFFYDGVEIPAHTYPGPRKADSLIVPVTDTLRHSLTVYVIDTAGNVSPPATAWIPRLGVELGDVNRDGAVNLVDLVMLINFLFRGATDWRDW